MVPSHTPRPTPAVPQHRMRGTWLRHLIMGLLLVLLGSGLAGCGGSAPTAIEVEAEHACAESAFLTFRNPGAAESVTRWVLHDSRGDHVLPPLHLAPGATLRVWRGAGQGDATNLYLAQPERTWQFANTFDVSVEQQAQWPWESTTAYVMGCHVDVF